MASYGQYKDIPSPSLSLSSNTSKHDSLNRGVSGPGGINRVNNVTATLRKGQGSKSPRGIGVHSPLPPMIGGTPNHNGFPQAGSNNLNQLQNPSVNNHSPHSASSPSTSLSNLFSTGALSKRFTVRLEVFFLIILSQAQITTYTENVWCMKLILNNIRLQIVS